jgi:O-antigen ligase
MMENVAARSAAPGAQRLRRIDVGAVSIWVLVGAIVLYLAIDGGGFDILVRSQAGIVVWWVVLIGAACGVLPAVRLTRLAWAALGLFACFLVWTALGVTWSLSSERSLQEVSRIACYLGILLLAITIHRDRHRAVRHTIGAVAASIVVVALLALLSRIRPDLIPAAQTTGTFLPGTQRRLSWPLNYWNALAALIAFGLPLLLAIATSARTLLAQAAAAAGIPILALCGYLTFSRGGVIAGVVAVGVFILVAPERIPKLATVLLGAVASVALIAGAVHRHAIDQGLVTSAARHQGSSLLVAVLLVCGGVALVQAGIGLAVRHGTPPRLLAVPKDRARVLSGVAIVVLVVAFLAVGGPTRLSHAWRDFKHPSQAGLNVDSLSRFGKLSGNGRYDYWNVAVKATGDSHLLNGFGPGTFQLVWLPRAPFASYVQNAHSLYVETFADLGLIGLLVLLGFFGVVIAAAVRLLMRTHDEDRTRAAGVFAALMAFFVSAAFDWVWQVPVLPAAFLLLAGAVLAAGRRRRPRPHGIGGIAIRVGIVGTGLLCLVAIGVPLATANDVRKSQTASASGNQAMALSDALAAARVEPGAASPQIQAALVLELQHNPKAAVVYARRATGDEPNSWSSWLVLSRLEAEAGHPRASLVAYSRARYLNPRSAVFNQ